MNWSYISGFFDGEGSLSCLAGGSARGIAKKNTIYIAQSGEQGEEVLTEIRAFLAERGIKSYLYHLQPPKGRRMHRLIICGRLQVEPFLKEVRPYVRVKRVVVQDTLRFFKIYPSLFPHRSMLAKERRRAFAWRKTN